MRKITIHVKKAIGICEKMQGLLFTQSAYILFLNTRFGLHTFGMKYSIDVIILDDRYKIVRLKRNLLSNKFFFWNPKYTNVLETPKGFIDKEKIKLGDIVNIRLIHG